MHMYSRHASDIIELCAKPGDDSLTLAATLEMFLHVSCNVVSVCKILLSLSEE